MEIGNNDLYKKHDKLIQLKKETYDKIYERCKKLIKLTSDTGELICIFEIPAFLFGSSYPIINIGSCANYIMNKLTNVNKNIKTAFIEPNFIFIDWRRDSDLNFRPFVANTHIPSEKKSKINSEKKMSSEKKYLSTERKK